LHDSRLTPTRDTLKHETCAAEFPAQCVAALERVSALIAQQAAHEPPLRLSRNLEDFREAQEPTPVRLLRARRLLICALLAEHRHDRQQDPAAAELTWPLPSGRPIIITLNFKAQESPGAWRRHGVGCCDRGSACPAVASPPGWARRYSSRTPVQHARATRRAACQAARTRGARARRLFGGVWRLGAAGGRGWQQRARLCSRRWSLVPRVRSRGAPVVWQLQCSARALSPSFRSARTGPRSERSATLTRDNDEWHTWSKRECSGQGVQRQVVRAARATARGLA